MGQSTDAILAYGYDLGEWDKIREAGEFGELTLPWLDDDSDYDYSDQAERHLLDVSGFTETWETREGDGYFKREEEAKAALGVQFETYCSDSAPMHVLAAKVITVARGHCEVLDLPALMAESTTDGWDDKLRAACEVLGITPTQERPGWVLVSYWGRPCDSNSTSARTAGTTTRQAATSSASACSCRSNRSGSVRSSASGFVRTTARR